MHIVITTIVILVSIVTIVLSLVVLPSLLNTKTTTTYVTAERFGGLGNQLFQIAASLVYGWRHGCQVRLSPTAYTKHVTVGSYDNTIFASMPRVKDETYRVIRYNNPFEPWDVSTRHDGHIRLHGHFQYFPSLRGYEAQLRAAILKHLPVIPAKPNTAGVHVRRGDYVGLSDIHTLQSCDSYYNEAMRLVSRPGVHFLVFSDDIPWCKTQPCFKDCDFYDNPNELETLATMASCKAGFVCANSTFSWWGAFLGAHAAGARVIVPKNWISGHTVVDLFPSEWIVV